MNTLEGIIKDVGKCELVSNKVIKKVRELIGEEEWNDLYDEENDVITTTGELLITLKGIPYLEAQIEKMKLCANCKHCGVSGWCHKLNRYLLDKSSSSCGNWGLKE